MWITTVNISWRSYSLIAFDERVTFWLQHIWSLPCVCVRMVHYLHVGLRITITQLHTYTIQQTRTHKAVTLGVEAKKLLSRRRQSEYSCSGNKVVDVQKLFLWSQQIILQLCGRGVIYQDFFDQNFRNFIDFQPEFVCFSSILRYFSGFFYYFQDFS